MKWFKIPVLLMYQILYKFWDECMSLATKRFLTFFLQFMNFCMLNMITLSKRNWSNFSWNLWSKIVFSGLKYRKLQFLNTRIHIFYAKNYGEIISTYFSSYF